MRNNWHPYKITRFDGYCWEYKNRRRFIFSGKKTQIKQKEAEITIKNTNTNWVSIRNKNWLVSNHMDDAPVVSLQ